MLERIEQLIDTGGTDSIAMLGLITVLDKIVGFLRVVADNDYPDQHDWITMAGIYAELLPLVKHRQLELLERPTVISRFHCGVSLRGKPGRPSYNIAAEVLQGYGFSWTKIVQILGVSNGLFTEESEK